MSTSPKAKRIGQAPQQVLVLTSPKAGRGQGREQLIALATRLEHDSITCHVMDSPAELKRRVDDWCASGDSRPVVVAAGGDGTVSLTASILTSEIPLVPMPMGTENLLALHFGFTNDADRVHATIVRGEDRLIDAASALPCRRDGTPRDEERMFLVMISAGFDAEVVRAVHLRRKGFISRWTYAGPIWRALTKYRFPEISHQSVSDDIPVEARDAFPTDPSTGSPSRSGWAMAFNLPRYAASMKIVPNADPSDGKLDVIQLAGRSVLSGVKYLLGILVSRHTSFQDVSQCRCETFQWNPAVDSAASDGDPASRFSHSRSRVPYQLDGDYLGRLPVRVRTLPNRVCLRLPPGD
ncbi:MAG: diacylglycerol kinase family protein [Planctomycetota bacterium]